MNREQIIKLAQQDPSFARGVDTMEEMLRDAPIMPEDLDEAIQLLEFALNNPDKYGEIREAAIQDGLIDPQMIPEKFDPVFVVSILVALYGLQDRLHQRGYARGGLAVAGRRLASQGRGGDTMLAHINPREAEMLQRMGGAGTINPNTGLREYKGGIGKILGAVLPIALSVIAPGIGTAIGGAISGGLGLGLGAAGTAALGSGVIGALGGAMSGGLRGAVLGGLTSGIGNYVMGPAGLGITGEGGSLSKMTDNMGLTGENGMFSSPTAMSSTSAAAATPSIAAAPDAASYEDYLSQVNAGTAAPGQMGPPLAQNAIAQAQGVDVPTPTARPTGDALSAIGGIARSPSDAVVSGLKNLIPGSDSILGTAFKYAPLALAAGSLLSQPQAVQQAVKGLSPEQQEYFNRPSTYWNWDQIQADANRSNMSLTDYISRNWNTITGGQYDQQQQETAPTVNKARGGPLSQIAYLAKGSGSGRDDTINARLSDGEYVMDAETTSLLGDGSNEEGARRWDQMRKAIRQQKGKALAKGKISPNAKSPLAYLKGVA